MDWIPEPSISDDTLGKRGESPFSWLSRSTLPRARAARSFLNRNLSQLPEDAQPVLYKALRSRWQSAFFELMVARTLQLLGASLVVEPESRIGSRIDFAAQFPDIIVNVEATSPVIDGHAGELLKARSQLLDIIEAEVPSRWGVGVIELPAIGPNDSKRKFHATIKRWLGSDPMHGFTDELVAEFPQGSLRLTLRRDPPGGVRVLFEPAITVWNDTEKRIRLAVGRKKRQARAAAGASIVAVHAGGISSTYQDFDRALFGKRALVLDESRKIANEWFDPDGQFAGRRHQPPVVDGVLAFVRVGLQAFPDPVLYLHPRSTRALPEALHALERRVLESERKKIACYPGRNHVLLTPLGFVSPDA